MKQTLKKAFATIGIGASLLLPVSATFAQSPFQKAQDDVNNIGKAAGVNTTKPLPVLVGSIINIILALLGMIFLILVLYAGFLWMTAAGEGKQVDKAKDILRQSIIGLIVIIAGFAISNYVLTSLVSIAT